MMTTNLFVNANVKQLRTDGSFRNLLPFFRTSWEVGVLNSAVFNSFHDRLEFGTILESLMNCEGEVEPLQTRPSVRHWRRINWVDAQLNCFRINELECNVALQSM